MASASIVAAEAEAEVDCSDTERAAPLHLTGIAAARGSTSAGKRKRKRCPKPGHVKCTLAQELEEDRKGSQAESFDARIAVRASVCILMLQPALSVLEYIGRPRGERWDFWEVYSGCGNFTAAALAAGLVVGPPVDLLHKAGGLALDLLLQDNQALLQAVLEEARPRWLHLAPPCTFLDCNWPLDSFQNAGNLGIASSTSEGALVFRITACVLAVSTWGEGVP